MKKKPCFVDFPQHRSKKLIFCLNKGLLNVQYCHFLSIISIYGPIQKLTKIVGEKTRYTMESDNSSQASLKTGKYLFPTFQTEASIRAWKLVCSR